MPRINRAFYIFFSLMLSFCFCRLFAFVIFFALICPFHLLSRVCKRHDLLDLHYIPVLHCVRAMYCIHLCIYSVVASERRAINRTIRCCTAVPATLFSPTSCHCLLFSSTEMCAKSFWKLLYSLFAVFWFVLGHALEFKSSYATCFRIVVFQFLFFLQKESVKSCLLILYCSSSCSIWRQPVHTSSWFLLQ